MKLQIAKMKTKAQMRSMGGRRAMMPTCLKRVLERSRLLAWIQRLSGVVYSDGIRAQLDLKALL